MVEQIRKEIEKIETFKFYLAMKDHWTEDDYATNAEYNRQIRELEKKAKEIEANN